MIVKLREFLEKNKLEALLVNSTNEFLTEYNSLEENSRYILTGFSGSTGEAVLTRNAIYLFVDGRYHIQADNEVDHRLITVVKLQNGETFFDKLKELLPEKSILGIVASKNSQSKIEMLETFYKIKLLNEDPLDKKLSFKMPQIEKIDISVCGKTSEDKIKEVVSGLGADEAILVTNLEEVSYLFNMRDFSEQYSSKVHMRAIITKQSAKLFGRDDFDRYQRELLSIKGKIYVDKSSINGRDFDLIKDKIVFFKKNPVQWMKAIKTDEEINHYIEAFKKTDLAVKAVRNFIESNDNISEYDIAEELEKQFKFYGAKSLSFRSIVAKDGNSALAHYSKSSRDEVIGEGSLVLIDCGAYYEGGLATDITRVFVKGRPSELQKKVYTNVLKAFLNAYNTEVKKGISGYDIDFKVRRIFEENHIDGFLFNHGLGHGIGINVHEYPPSLSCNELSKVHLEDNMCFTIEPGLYNREHFGVRLENSCYLKNCKIHSFTKMNYEKKLIDYGLLNEQEKSWLEMFEVI